MSCVYGEYVAGSSDFCITEADIPRNWYNYLWNDGYITYTSQTCAGESLAQDDLGRRIKLVADRGFFITEGKRHWGIGGLPVDEMRDSFRCIHSHGRSDVITENYGIRSTVSITVPVTGDLELWQVKVENLSDSERCVRVCAFMGSAFDASYARQAYNTEASAIDGDVLYITKRTNMYGKQVTAYGFMALSGREGYSGRYNGIIGPYGSFAHPAFLRDGGFESSIGCGEKLGYGMDKSLVLAAGESGTVVFVVGIAYSLAEAHAMHQKYGTGEAFESACAEVKAKFAAEERGVSINTPDPLLNNMFEWLKHQTNMGSRWARVRHNGYRDLTSDTDCLANIDPELALQRLLRIFTYQDSSGYAPRTFIDGQIKPNNFSDNTVWLTFTAYSVLKELGRREILDTVVKYNDGTEGTVYEHLYRSVDFLYNFRGINGFIRIWGGDWNDCMNRVGIEGRGVSVWLSIAWCRAAKMFAEIADIYGKPEDARLVRERLAEMKQIVETHGWDGEYYIDAINDNGGLIGSSSCEEGKMFLIPQIWAVFSGLTEHGRDVIAMDSVEKYLSDPLGTVISVPPYSKYDHTIGAVTAKHPGIHENGGVYLHTMAWKIAAEAMLKRADRVERDIECILPFRNKVVNGRAEPYIMCNSYFGKQTGYRYGTPGQSWRTAAGQWFGKALVNYVFGLMPEMEGLRVDPCLPPSWKTASVTKHFRGTTYNISYVNGGTRVKNITVNGELIEGNILPLVPGVADVVVTTE